MPIGLSISFTIVVQTLSLSAFVPVPVAVLIGLGWGAAIALVANWVAGKPRASAWCEDVLVALGLVAMAALAFAGGAGLLVMSAALDSSSLTGETLVLMFLPSIPIAIAANTPIELLVVPALLVLGWRAGRRCAIIIAAAALFLIHRVWTQLVFAADRLDFAAMEQSTVPLTEAERRQIAADLQIEDPRWILNLVIFALFVLAAHYSRVRASQETTAVALDRP